MNGSLKVFKSHLCDLVKTTFGNGVFELNLKNLVEKHLVYSIAFIDFLFKDETLNDSILQNIKSCAKIENYSLGAALLYSLTFKEFLDENGFKHESFQKRGRCMTRDTQETVELLQSPVTRAMARRMEEEHRGKIAIFESARSIRRSF
ncbi:hypothetical protein M9H77_30272 [Catharanthus roseus]|uniref:Uncharacterized protein n=1 Tax=Catharanthus roseus TaxID=4058 RepID=A0ACB9ZXT5_CATRO|nr:hypothetical protein M9H77_30272 [Catharanthus roseus]